MKARYSTEQEADLDVFAWTPTPESHSLLEVYALQKKWCTRSLDIVAAFLIGRDRGASEGKPVYVRAPVEWHDLFGEWLSTLPAGEKAKYKDSFKEMYFPLDGNLYGRRTAGSVYRNELEGIICERIDPQRYQFQRGVKDPCLFRCLKTGVILVHHVDDIRAAGPAEVLADFFEKEFPKYCEVQAGELEMEGTAVEFLGRNKIRTKDAIVTVPDAKHRKAIIAAAGITAKDRAEVPSKQLDLMRVDSLDDEKTKRFRSAVGSAIYLSADRRDIQYERRTRAKDKEKEKPRGCQTSTWMESGNHYAFVISQANAVSQIAVSFTHVLIPSQTALHVAASIRRWNILPRHWHPEVQVSPLQISPTNPDLPLQSLEKQPIEQIDNSASSTVPPQMDSTFEEPHMDGTFCPKTEPSIETVPRSPSNQMAISMESITSAAGSRIFLDLCAGYQRPLSASLQKFYCDVCTFDILVHPEDDLLDDTRYELLLRLACSRQVAYSAGSPSCNECSRLKLRPGGPVALRTPDQLDGVPGLTFDQQLRLQCMVQPCFLVLWLVWFSHIYPGDIAILNNHPTPWAG